MSGTWSKSQGKHSRIKLSLEDGDVFFNDIRNFGTLKIVKGKDLLINKLNSLGPDMLNDDIDDDLFSRRIKLCKKKTVTQAIMDQSIIAGVGNYLKAESLYISKISPHRSCEDLTSQEISLLNESIKKTIRASYETGGATISTYTGFEGEIGEYSQRFLVYNQKTDPHGNPVIKEKTKDGRTTHWVPNIQR
jgi:DNA-formamidopyrimidine glycosylase